MGTLGPNVVYMVLQYRWHSCDRVYPHWSVVLSGAKLQVKKRKKENIC